MGSRRRGKAPLGPKEQCCAFRKLRDLIESTGEAQTAVRSSLVPNAVLLTRPRTMNAPSWFHSIGKKSSEKADLAIYCLVLGVSG